MNIALISNGPSARLYIPGDGDHLVIAVNKAAARYHADWWVFCDASMWIGWAGKVLPVRPGTAERPRVFTRRSQVMQLVPLHQNSAAAAAITEWPLWFHEDAHPVHPFAPIDGCAWGQYSGLAALGWLYRFVLDPLHFGYEPHREPITATLYGYDLGGVGDVMADRVASDPVEVNSREDARRWSRERAVFDQWMELLGRFCEVRRVGE